MSSVWTVRQLLLRLPGAYELVGASARLGHGSVRRIPVGPLQGLSWRHDRSLPLWYRMGLYEPDVARLIQAHLRPGDSFWDLGANAGYHSLVGACTVGSNGFVLAVEADPVVFALLNGEIALNPRVAPIVATNAAVADRIGVIEFVRAPNNRQSSVAGLTGVKGDLVSVPATTLDQLAAEYGPPALIKMDIEGGERLAMPGGSVLFSADGAQPRLLLSIHGDDLEEYCRGFLEGHGYVISTDPAFPQMLICLPRGAAPSAAGNTS